MAEKKRKKEFTPNIVYKTFSDDREPSYVEFSAVGNFAQITWLTEQIREAIETIEEV